MRGADNHNTRAAPWWRDFHDDLLAQILLERDDPGALEATLDFIEAQLGVEAGAHLFDQCCGIGSLALPLAARGYRVSGVDQAANYIDRARTAFRFMWGVGVNEPWPVANLYPVVQSGDPDWKAYYTVNLLNLPHHYHNGGLWPFVGGMWVRFIHRLGFHDVACRELVRLAKLNQLGRDQDWEFNEWAHGQTGKPMGKAFQAWSAACYLRACQEVEIDPTHLNDD